MRKFATACKRSLIGLLVLLQILFYPSAALAQEAPPAEGSTESSTTATTSDPAPTSPAPSGEPAATSTATATPATGPSGPTGPSAPTGAPSSTYTYNESTGLWENDYYTWDPVTHQTAPKTAQNYSYNPATGMWDTTEWVFDAPSGKYVPNVASTASIAVPPNDPLIQNTGPNSSNNIGVSNDNDATFNLFYNATISNTINSNATSGNASVLQNTNGGSALTGDATTIVNLLNLLQASWDPDLAFTASVNGDFTGDLLLNPNQILNSGPSSQNGIVTSGDNNLDVTIEANSRISNDVDTAATSGDALVSENTTGGDAESGDANVLVNILNLINSAISSDSSFLGVINILGNLDGDILLPQNLVAQLDTTGPNSTNTITQNGNTTTNVVGVDNRTITNNIDLSAVSGDASVSENTNAGSAQTGDASTKINIYNLTGRSIIGDNALLVFVNLQGKWTGLIFDAPAGSNTVLGTGPNSTNTINDTTNTDTNVDATANSTIENDITAHAESGDAEVSRNTNGGNAKTGTATATANIVNLINSQLSLDGWFGILFINVLGTWNGSFGVDTAAGDPPAVLTNADGSPAVFSLVPTGDNKYAAVAATGSQSSSNSNNNSVVSGTTNVSGNTPAVPKVATKKSKNTQAAAAPKANNMAWVVTVGFAAGLLLLAGERFIALVQLARNRFFLAR